MGNISDRSNPKYFITIGLLGSALVSLIFGLVPGVLSSIPLMIVLAALNGWFQGMGYPPGAKTMPTGSPFLSVVCGGVGGTYHIT